MDVGWIPTSFFDAIGRLDGIVFLSGPVILAGFWIWWLTRTSMSVRFLPAAIPASLLSVTIPLVAGTAGFIAAVRHVAETGEGGFPVAAGMTLALSQSALRGVLTLAMTLLVTAVILLAQAARARRPEQAERSQTLSARATLGLASMLGVAAVGVGILVNVHYELVQVTMATLSPYVQSEVNVSDYGWLAIADIQSRDSTVVFLGGGLLTALSLTGGLVALAACSSRRPRRALVLFSALCLAVILVIAIWWAVRLNGTVSPLHALV